MTRWLQALSRTFPSVGGHIAMLDGMRGIAVLLVIVSHASLIDIDIVPGLDMSGTGKVGVFLFFVLSAFLLVHQCLHLDAKGALDGRAWLRYALRRVLRIYPLYVVFLLFCLWAPVEHLFGPWALADVGNHLLVREGAWHTWSVAVELRWYLVLPFVVLAWVYLARRSFAAATVAIAIAMAARDWIDPPFDVDALRIYINIFLAGTWVALAHRELASRAAGQPAWLPTAAAVLGCAAFAVVLLLTPSIMGMLTGEVVPLNRWHRAHTMFALLWAACLLGLLNAPAGVQRVFAWLPLRVLGVISFSAYLWHGVVLANLGWLPFAPGHYGNALLVLAAIVVSAAASFVVIERPFLRPRAATRATRGEAEHPD